MPHNQNQAFLEDKENQVFEQNKRISQEIQAQLKMLEKISMQCKRATSVQCERQMVKFEQPAQRLREMRQKMSQSLCRQLLSYQLLSKDEEQTQSQVKRLEKMINKLRRQLQDKEISLACKISFPNRGTEEEKTEFDNAIPQPDRLYNLQSEQQLKNCLTTQLKMIDQRRYIKKQINPMKQKKDIKKGKDKGQKMGQIPQCQVEPAIKMLQKIKMFDMNKQKWKEEIESYLIVLQILNSQNAELKVRQQA